jgi:predicted thioesterase
LCFQRAAFLLAWAIMRFSALADYERYRARLRATKKRNEISSGRAQRFILSEERTFLKVVNRAANQARPELPA